MVTQGHGTRCSVSRGCCWREAEEGFPGHSDKPGQCQWFPAGYRHELGMGDVTRQRSWARQCQTGKGYELRHIAEEEEGNARQSEKQLAAEHAAA